MKSTLTFDKKPVFVGNQVYQIGLHKGLHKLFEFTIKDIDGDKLTISFENEFGPVEGITNAGQVHSNKLELLKSWIDKKIEYYYKQLPAEIADLINIIETNGGTVEPGIKERFGALNPNESL